jgi:hypothetical protein
MPSASRARPRHDLGLRRTDGCSNDPYVIPRDPDSEIITATEVTPGNAADGSVGQTLLAEALADGTEPEATAKVEV